MKCFFSFGFNGCQCVCVCMCCAPVVFCYCKRFSVRCVVVVVFCVSLTFVVYTLALRERFVGTGKCVYVFFFGECECGSIKKHRFVCIKEFRMCLWSIFSSVFVVVVVVASLKLLVLTKKN